MRLVGAVAVLLTYDPTGYSFLSLGGAGLRCDHRGESVHRGNAAGRVVDRLHSYGICCLRSPRLVLSALVLGTLVWMLQDYGIQPL